YAKRAHSIVRRRPSGCPKLSFVCGLAGVLAMEAVLCHARGDHDACVAAVGQLLDIEPQRDEPCDQELLYGRAGYISALLFVLRRIHDRRGSTHGSYTAAGLPSKLAAAALRV